MIYDRSNDGLAEGCCSAAKPCSHQKRDPYSICATCGGSATTERGDADTYTTEAIACGLSDVAGWLENEGGREKHARTIRLGVERLRALGAASGGEAELDWLLKQVVELCEHTEDEMHEALEKGPTNEHEIGFYKGRKWEAKGIRRAIAEVVRLRKSELQSFADAAAPSHPGEADRVGPGELERLVEVARAYSEAAVARHAATMAYHAAWDEQAARGIRPRDMDLAAVGEASRKAQGAESLANVDLCNAAKAFVPASLAALGTGEGSGGAPNHVMCIGWPTIARLAAGESVWFEDIQAGAVAADDLFSNDIEAARLLGMRDDQVRAEAIANGEDPDALADSVRDGVSAVVEMHKQNASLKAAVSGLLDLATWMSGSADFGREGQAHEGWLKMKPAIDAGFATLRASQEQDSEVRS